MASPNCEAVKRLHRRKRKSVDDWLSFGCDHCGTKEGPIEAHHVDPSTKEFNIRRGLTSAGWKRLLAELDKCIPLCRTCHAKTHNTNGNLSIINNVYVGD